MSRKNSIFIKTEAHDGIFEILPDGEITYTNQAACNKVPAVPEALKEGVMVLTISDDDLIRMKAAFPH